MGTGYLYCGAIPYHRWQGWFRFLHCLCWFNPVAWQLKLTFIWHLFDRSWKSHERITRWSLSTENLNNKKFSLGITIEIAENMSNNYYKSANFKIKLLQSWKLQYIYWNKDHLPSWPVPRLYRIELRVGGKLIDNLVDCLLIYDFATNFYHLNQNWY